MHFFFFAPKSTFRRLLALLVILSAGLAANAQTDPDAKFLRKYGRQLEAYQFVQSLHDSGTLVVLLVSERNRVNSLERQLHYPDLTERQRELTEKDLQSLKANIQARNKDIIAAFADIYRGSRVVFSYDTCARELKNGIRTGIFIDSTLRINPDITVTKPLVVLQFATAEKLWLLRDSTLNPLPKYYPQQVRTSFTEELDDPLDIAGNTQSEIFGHYARAMKQLPRLAYIRNKMRLKASMKAMKQEAQNPKTM